MGREENEVLLDGDEADGFHAEACFEIALQFAARRCRNRCAVADKRYVGSVEVAGGNFPEHGACHGNFRYLRENYFQFRSDMCGDGIALTPHVDDLAKGVDGLLFLH